MSLTLEVHLEERLHDRVRALIRLSPNNGVMGIEGVAVELFDEDRNALGPRVLLPIAGQLSDSLVMRVELRCEGALPPGAMILATAWHGADSTKAMTTTDPWTAFEAHIRGKRCVCSGAVIPFDDDLLLEGMTAKERHALSSKLPWIGEKLRPPSDPRYTSEKEPLLPHMDVVDDITDELGLCDEDKELLRELLREDSLE